METNCTFGFALAWLKGKRRITRAGWNGSGMWLKLVDGRENLNFAHFNGLVGRDFIVIKTADNQVVPWVASQTDLLANDWIILDDDTEL